MISLAKLAIEHLDATIFVASLLASWGITCLLTLLFLRNSGD